MDGINLDSFCLNYLIAGFSLGETVSVGIVSHR